MDDIVSVDDPLSTDDLSLMYDPTRPSLDTRIAGGFAFSVPWCHDVKPFLSGFDSSRTTWAEGPWLLSSPFDEAGMHFDTIIFDKNNFTASFRDGMSTNISSSADHLSVSAGVTIGYSFLSGSVSGKYDKHVVKNESVSSAFLPVAK